MAQKDVEVILMRELASYLAMPVFLVDPAGTLLFYNEPAEMLLGRPYDETGEMLLDNWTTAFTPTDETGSPLAPDTLPLFIALKKHRAAHRVMWIRALDGVSRQIAVTAFPPEGQGGRHLGAVAIFWESPGP